ncbi:hypothetical protein [Xanthobacter flavus]|uniref:hypothetical protein n=1 Tax=Xanthobacter flavus TaxID=281 RepID=UPI00372C62F7
MFGYAEAISSLALLISFGSYVLHWRAWKQAQSGREPEVWVEEISCRDFPEPWRAIRITIRARADEGTQLTEIRLRKPKGGVIARYYGNAGHDDHGRYAVSLPVNPTNVARATLAVAHAGAPGYGYAGMGLVMGSADEHHEDFLLNLPPPSRSAWFSSTERRSVSLCMAFSSRSHPARRTTKLIRVMIQMASTPPATQ